MIRQRRLRIVMRLPRCSYCSEVLQGTTDTMCAECAEIDQQEQDGFEREHGPGRV